MTAPDSGRSCEQCMGGSGADVEAIEGAAGQDVQVQQREGTFDLIQRRVPMHGSLRSLEHEVDTGVMQRIPIALPRLLGAEHLAHAHPSYCGGGTFRPPILGPTPLAA